MAVGIHVLHIITIISWLSKTPGDSLPPRVHGTQQFIPQARVLQGASGCLISLYGGAA